MDERERITRRVAALDVILDNIPTEIRKGDPEKVDRAVAESYRLHALRPTDDEPTDTP